MSQDSEILSPSLGSSSRRGKIHEQIQKPLADSYQDEAYPEDDNFSSDDIVDEDIPFSDREVVVEDPRSPKPLHSFEPNAMRRYTEKREASRLRWGSVAA